MTRRIVASSAALILAILLANPSHAAVVTLHADDFAYIASGNSTNTSGSGTAFTAAGIYVVANVYNAGGAVRLANTSNAGSLTTTNLFVQAGTLIVGVDAKGWNSDEKIFYISVAGQSSTIDCTYDMSGSFETFSRTFSVEDGAVSVTFHTPPKKRVFLDNILITQEVPDDMVPLAAPVALPPTATNETSFSAAWSAVANAESYQVAVFALTVNGSTTNATPIAGSPFTVAAGTTTLSATGLTQDSLYRYSVVAVGNGTTTGNSPASNAITVRTAVSTIIPIFTVTPETLAAVQELSSVAFSIVATLGGNPVAVSYVGGLPSGASYAVTNLVGNFSWTPALGQAGVYPLKFTAPGGDGLTYTNTVAITVNALPLTAPANLVASNIDCEAFDLSWSAVPAATQGYVASVWTGSASPDTPTADMETFWETTDKNPVQPLGWSFTGITLEYMYRGLNEVSFDTTGDTIVTRLYPKAVTELSFRLQGQTTASTNDSVLAVFGTADGTTWTSLASYSTLADSDGDDENNIFSVKKGDLEKNIALDVASGFRQFKFVYTQDKGNVGIGNIAAVYEGAGTKFVTGWNGAAVAGTGMVVNGVRPGRIYYALVGARNATETQFSQIAMATLDAPRATLLVVR